MGAGDAAGGEELAFAGIARQAELLRGREVSSRELTKLYLERIERLDPRLNAFRVVLAEQALAEAGQADRRLATDEEAPLLGVPVAIKDDTDVAGELTTHGTDAHGGVAATADAPVVARLRDAGAVIIGKTNVPEFESCGFTETEAFGVTRNPWSLDHTPGGSSGGSAAAVAAGQVGVAQGTDGAGSIRIPSSNCGLFGLKTQRGRVPFTWHEPPWHGLSVAGPIARTVGDAALFLDAVHGALASDPDPPTPPARPYVEAARAAPPSLRIGMSFRPSFRPAPLHPSFRAAVEETAELLRSLGHRVDPVEPAYLTMGTTQGLARMVRGIRDDALAMPDPKRIDRRSRGFVRWGALYPPPVMRAIRRLERRHARRLGRAFRDHDVLLTPTTAQPAPRIGRWDGQGALRSILGEAAVYPYNVPWNVTGQPAAAVPAGSTDDGLPLSVQLVGHPDDEGTLISLAAQLEAERPWAGRRPPVS
ncbi:MAG: amidase [Solirubrobacterales bacterium]